MPHTQTSPEIIVLLLLAAALTLLAWWLSNRQLRRFREFVVWIEANHSELWQDLPWASREFNAAGGVEHLRRHDLRDDPQFMTRYQNARRVRWPQVTALFAGMGAIGLVALGIDVFGWTF